MIIFKFLATLVLLASAFIFTGVSLPTAAWLSLGGLLGLAARAWNQNQSPGTLAFFMREILTNVAGTIKGTVHSEVQWYGNTKKPSVNQS